MEKVLRTRSNANNKIKGFLVGAFIGGAFLVFAGYQRPLYALEASWYSAASLKAEGTWRRTRGVMANGEKFDETQATCATRLYKIGTVLKITNTENGKSTICMVRDRIGKRFAQTRIDLAKHSFMEIADCKQGLVPIIVEVLQ